MAGIQASNGLITGIDIQGTVDQLMAIAAKPRDRLKTQVAGLQSQQVAVGQLTALVIGVQLATDQLGRSTLYDQTKIQSSATSITATANGTARAGRYQYVPIQLAQQQQFTSTALASADQLVGAGKIEIHAGGFLDTSVALDELNGGVGVSRGQIRITDRSGSSATIDLRYAHSAEDVVNAINSSGDIRVTAKLDGDRFTLVDSSGGSGTLSVAEVSGGTTARDLGLGSIAANTNTASGADVLSLSRSTSLRSLLDGRGVQFGAATENSLRITLRDGTTVDYKSSLKSNSGSVGQLIDAINAAGNGKVRASINSAGNGLKLEDLTSGTGTFAVTSPKGTLARDLGWDVTSSGGVLSGAQLQAGLGDVLLSSLNGGAGLGTLGSLNLTDRSGATASVDLSSAKTVGDVLSAINASGIGVRARLNDTRTGITLTDTSGGTTTSIAATSTDSTASKLGLSTTTDPARLDGKSLQRQWINRNTNLSDWDQGRGLTLGSIKITNSAGVSSAVNLAQAAPKTIGDVLDAINANAQGFEARINETGDGLLIVDTANGTKDMQVVDVSGTTAKQLHLAGTSKALTVGNAAAKGIDGSLDFSVTTTAETKLSDLVTQLNAADDTLNASILNLGAGGVRLAISSAASGAGGRLALDSSSLAMSFSETSKAQNALLSVGGSSAGGGVLISSSSNKFTSVAPGLDVTINEATKSVVTIDVTENTDALSKQISSVVDQFNKLRDKLDELTQFDAARQTSGALFGSSEALRIELAFGQLFSGTIKGNGSVKSMAELGISFTESGKLEFNKSRLSAALSRDPDAVKKFFTTSTTGFAAKAKAVADTLAGTKKGALLERSNTLQTKIELTNKRIDTWSLRLDSQRNQLLTQFYNMETAISKIKSNLNSINQIAALNTQLTTSNSNG